MGTTDIAASWAPNISNQIDWGERDSQNRDLNLDVLDALGFHTSEISQDIIEKEDGRESIYNKISEKLNDVNVRKRVVDAVVSNLICALLVIPQEMLVAGLDITQFTRGRILNILPNSLSGGIYGAWRDFVLKKIPENLQNNKLQKFLVDSLVSMSYTTLHAPIYYLILTLAGATADQGLVASLGDIASAAFTGRIYGILMEYGRKMLGVKEETKEKVETVLSQITEEKQESGETHYTKVDRVQQTDIQGPTLKKQEVLAA